MIEIRLREPLRYWNRDELDLWLALGRTDLPEPSFVVPARTTLRLVDFPTADFRALCFTPDGKRVLVPRETLRDHGYVPRGQTPEKK